MKARSLPRSAYTVLRSLSWKKKHRLAVEPAEESRSSLLEGERRRRSRWRSPEGEVPRGFFAVYVGQGLQRYVVPTEFLCRPAMRELMELAAEEFGFRQEEGFRIPCDVEEFEVILSELEVAEGKSANVKWYLGLGLKTGWHL